MDVDVLIIGAGACGLAIAERISREGHSVILLEKETRHGTGISSRSTEVIHAGIYYHTGSLKAVLCSRGKTLLYEFCQKHGVRHARTGKVFLASTREDAVKLDETLKQARKNGILDLESLDKAGISKEMPGIEGYAGLLSPSSGIFDTHGFMDALLHKGNDNGVIFSPASPFENAEFISGVWNVKVGGREPCSVRSRFVINSAGLNSIQISGKVFTGRVTPRLYPTKGSYLRYSGAHNIRRIIYPALRPGAIEERVDITPDLAGNLRFGPDVDIPKDLNDFNVSELLLEKLKGSIEKMIPSIVAGNIHADCAGIRPRIYGPGQPVMDFIFEWAPQEGWMDLFGIESPGLTASLAIGEHVYTLMKQKGCL